MVGNKWILHIVKILYISLLLIADSAFGSDCFCSEISDTNLLITCNSKGTLTASDMKNCSESEKTVTHLTVTMNESSRRDRALSIEEDAFSAFPNVNSIILSSLGLKSLHSLTFLFQLQLNQLDLSHNQLSEISNDLFISEYDSLRSLNLSHNNLSVLPSDFFLQLVHLQSLDLSYNKFVSLPKRKPSNWPAKLELLLSNNFLPPCWTLHNKTEVLKRNHWWCDKYSQEVKGIYSQHVSFACKGAGSTPHNSTVYWQSPKKNFFKAVNETSTWWLFFLSNFDPSSVSVSDKVHGAELSVKRMRPYFRGVWSCLSVQWKDGGMVLQVIDQVMLSCISTVRTTYHWSLIVSVICTGALVLAGLLSALIRILWLTRCFTRKVHVVSALSLHDLQYSPRLAEQRIKILRRHESAHAAAANSATASLSSCDSFLPAWLPPHRQRSVDPFAHGGGPVTSDEETDSMLEPPPFSSDEELEEAEAEDMLETDDNRVKRRMDELTERLRKDMVKRVDHVRTRMKERRHTMEESTSKVMRSLRSGSVVAASKMRSGFHNSMETVKFKVKTVADFCGGGGASLGQTVSVSTLDTDLDTQTTVERRIADVTAV